MLILETLRSISIWPTDNPASDGVDDGSIIKWWIWVRKRAQLHPRVAKRPATSNCRREE
jgi:hypothetical protein